MSALKATGVRIAMMAFIGAIFYISAAVAYINHERMMGEWTRATATVEFVTPIERGPHMRYTYSLAYSDGGRTYSVEKNGGGKAPFESGDTIEVLFNPADATDVRPVPAEPAAAIGFLLFGGTLALCVAGLAFLRRSPLKKQ